MSFYLSYQVNGIDGQFVMLIQQSDDVKYVSSQIKKEFGIIQELTASIYGSELQGSNIISKCVREQDVVTFDIKEKDKFPDLQLYRKSIINPRYQSETTFIIFSTINFKGMTVGNKIQIDIEKDTIPKIQEKIREMIKKNYKDEMNPKKIAETKILLFLPGGIPFIVGKISDFKYSFPDYMPHLYAILVNDSKITDKVLDQVFDTVCNIKDEKMKSLLSPDVSMEINGLCEIAAVLGYIQQNGQNVKRMIYSIAKYCPFAPMINGLYSLACMSRATGRIIIQITAPLFRLFEEMASNLSDQSNIFASTVKFLTFFMNIKISDRIPCTEFVRPFYNIGFESYFNKNFPEKAFPQIQSIVAFDPDFRDMDWIRFELPSLHDEDFREAMKLTRTLQVIPPMSLREMHRVSLFNGKNGPWLFLAASVSKDETDRDKIDYINPENGVVENDTYENIAVKAIGVDYKKSSEEFDRKVVESIDPEKVKQLVFIVIDKSGSMRSGYSDGLNRYQASQKFFIKFTEACYRFHTTSLYGSIVFNSSTEVRNELNPLIRNFRERMIIENERPGGGTRMFTAMKKAADLILRANQGNKYPNAVFRIIVISDGQDGCGIEETKDVSNFLLQNKFRVDAIIVSNDIARGLVAISEHTGGIATFPRSVQEGLELFNKEEFFNVDLREFGPIHAPNLTTNDFKNLPHYAVDDLHSNIKIKPNIYADPKKLVTSPQYAISEYNKEVISGSVPETAHRSQKRIIQELRKIIAEPDEDVRVYPLKDRIDVWRVLIQGFEGSLYDKKWFYMIIEFGPEYPTHYPLFRFVKPPFHPNITDQGRVCIDSLDQNYRSDMSIRELIGKIRLLLFEPNFKSPVDLKREKLVQIKDFERIVKQWNESNGKDSPEDWLKEWKIQPDGNLFQGDLCIATVPEQFLCPINRKIMKEPVKATSGVYYEKVALEKYLKTTPNPTCRGKCDESGKPIPLPPKDNMNLQVDNEMKTRINKWIKDNDYHEDEDDDENDEEKNVALFLKKEKPIEKPDYLINYTESEQQKIQIQYKKKEENADFSINRHIPRLRPQLRPSSK